jgi:hypothetical protein
MLSTGDREHGKKAKKRNAAISEKVPTSPRCDSGDLEEVKVLVYDEREFHSRKELEAKINECKRELKTVAEIRDPGARRVHLKDTKELLAAYQRVRKGNPPASGRTVWKGTEAEAASEIRKGVEKRKHRFRKDLQWASNAFYATHDFPGDPGMTEESLYIALKETRPKRKPTTKPADETTLKVH